MRVHQVSWVMSARGWSGHVAVSTAKAVAPPRVSRTSSACASRMKTRRSTGDRPGIKGLLRAEDRLGAIQLRVAIRGQVGARDLDYLVGRDAGFVQLLAAGAEQLGDGDREAGAVVQ